MTRLMLCLFSILILLHPKDEILNGTYRQVIAATRTANQEYYLSKMQALDLVKIRYANNFIKVFPEETNTEYYYKLPDVNYYLVYEGNGGTNQEYLFHLYEFVLDEPDTGIGHTYTYGWYTVDKYSGDIIDQTQ